MGGRGRALSERGAPDGRFLAQQLSPSCTISLQLAVHSLEVLASPLFRSAPVPAPAGPAAPQPPPCTVAHPPQPDPWMIATLPSCPCSMAWLHPAPSLASCPSLLSAAPGVSPLHACQQLQAPRAVSTITSLTAGRQHGWGTAAQALALAFGQCHGYPGEGGSAPRRASA